MDLIKPICWCHYSDKLTIQYCEYGRPGCSTTFPRRTECGSIQGEKYVLVFCKSRQVIIGDELLLNITPVNRILIFRQPVK